MNKFKFYLAEERFKGIELEPEPAINCIPEWYRKMESYHGGQVSIDDNGATSLTAKKCVPMFDAMTSGYLIKLPIDVLFKNGAPSWTSNVSKVMAHKAFQVEGMPMPPGFADYLLKWENQWVIKTPPGYSTMFFHPTLRNDAPFFSFSGTVDTDVWNLPIHFPFLIRNNYSGIIERGTPIIQAVPFKREAWSKENGGDFKDIRQEITRHFAYIKNHYRNKFWNKKQYR